MDKGDTKARYVRWRATAMNKPRFSGALYALGAVGAIVYYVQHSSGLWEGILAVAKGLVWPAMVVYKVLDLLKM